MIPAEKGVYPVVTHSFADAEKGAVGMIQVEMPKQFATMSHFMHSGSPASAAIRLQESLVQSIRVTVQRLVFIVAALLLLVPASRASAQAGAHLILVKMVDKPDAQFAFEPAAIVAQRGDTVRFIQASTAPHNVHFEKTPKGAKLGAASSGPYIIGTGTTYNLVIDARFVDGTYQFICDPHQSVGMRGTLTVGQSTK